MKKVLVAILALGGMAAAETITNFDWTVNPSYSSAVTVSSEGNLTYNSAGWNVYNATASLGESAITLSEPTDALTLEFEFDFNSSNSVLTMALAGENGAVVVGRTYNDNAPRLGVTTETGDAVSRGYAFSGTNNSDHVANITEGTTTISGKTFAVNAGSTVNSNAVTFNVAYSAEQSQFVGTLTYGGASASINLGQSFNVNAITATFDGTAASHVGSVSLTVTPEPCTGTLGMLALAGLAARRRRK